MNNYKLNYSTPLLIVMVGLPGSGKDYIIKNIIRDNPDIIFHVASTDDIIEKYADSIGKTYSDVFDEAIKPAIKQMDQDITNSIKERKNIIWNQTNTGLNKRKSIINKFPEEYTKIAVVITVDPEIHTSRLKNREENTGKGIPNFVINTMRNSYVEPTLGEGFDDIIKIDNS
jgi:predicted kinase